MTATPQLEAKKHALRQNQDGGWRLTLNTQPDDKLPGWLMDGAPGLRLYVTIKDAEQFDNQESPSQSAPPLGVSSAAPPGRTGPPSPVSAGGNGTKRKPLSPGSRAALMCKDPRSWPVLVEIAEHWLGATPKIESEQEAASCLRGLCGVESRAEIIDGDQEFGVIETEYKVAIGQIARP